jgi:hypothetical protein
LGHGIDEQTIRLDLRFLLDVFLEESPSI